MRAGAVVLAAGAGTRLGGRCKATLPLRDGRTFLAAIREAARAAGCDEVVVVGAPPHAEEVRAACADATFVVNPTPARGMVESLRRGLAALDPGVDRALVWPVDHPAVLSSTARAILEASAGASIVVPCFEGRGGHPTALAVDVWPELIAAPDARTVIRKDPGRVVRLGVADPAVVLDVDTPSDYDRIKGGGPA